MGNWRDELLNDLGQIDLRYGAYRRYLLLSDWQIGLLNNTYLRHRQAYDKQYSDYRTDGNSYDTVIDFYTSPVAHSVYLDDGSLSLCLRFLYNYKRIMGAELADIVMDGSKIKLDVQAIHTCYRSELFYKVINGEVLNIHMDNRLKLSYGTPYLSSMAYSEGLFRPLKLRLDKAKNENDSYSVKELLDLDLSYYLNCSDFDISSSRLVWRYDKISRSFAERVKQARGY